jgi:hypothetical protein
MVDVCNVVTELSSLVMVFSNFLLMVSTGKMRSNETHLMKGQWSSAKVVIFVTRQSSDRRAEAATEELCKPV